MINFGILHYSSLFLSNIKSTFGGMSYPPFLLLLEWGLRGCGRGKGGEGSGKDDLRMHECIRMRRRIWSTGVCRLCNAPFVANDVSNDKDRRRVCVFLVSIYIVIFFLDSRVCVRVWGVGDGGGVSCLTLLFVLGWLDGMEGWEEGKGGVRHFFRCKDDVGWKGRIYLDGFFVSSVEGYILLVNYCTFLEVLGGGDFCKYYDLGGLILPNKRLGQRYSARDFVIQFLAERLRKDGLSIYSPLYFQIKEEEEEEEGKSHLLDRKTRYASFTPSLSFHPLTSI